MQDIDDLVEAIVSEMDPDAEAQAMEAQEARMEAFSTTLQGLRKAAIEARKASGIEDQWQEDEDHYEGIDNTNRTTASRVKPYDFGGTGTGPTRNPEKGINRSTIFVPMTRPYVDIAAARISDMYLPTDERNWDGEPTPIPELVHVLKNAPPKPPAAPAPVMMPQGPAPAGMPGGAMAQPPVPPTPVDQAQAIMDSANEAWELARTQIDDWLQECNYNGELRKVIHDMARIGVGILKGPFPRNKVAKAIKQSTGGFALEIEQKIVPGSVRVDAWNFYPAADCMENVNECSHLFEEGTLTRSKLRDLKADGLGYIQDAVDKCLEEGPMHPVTSAKKNKGSEKNETDIFSVWYFEGQIEWQNLKDAGCDVSGKPGDVFHAMATMVNDRVIKASLHHLDSGEFTYDVGVWQRKSGMWAGDGVARQGRTAQLGLNSAARAMMDNAGESSKPHKVLNRAAIEKGPDPWTWYMAGDADMNDVAHAMTFFTVPSIQQELMAIIQYFNKLFEDSTGLPMLLMGQQGAAPETVGGMEMLQNNAGTVPRNIVRMLDDRITAPHIKRYYEYLLIHGEDEKAKGDFNIYARGSSALVERDAQSQFLISIMQLALNPACEIDPSLFIDELLKSKRINPERLKLSDEKKQEMASRQPPEDPRVTAAKIMASAGIAKVQAQGQVDGQLQAQEGQQELQRIAQESAQEQDALMRGGATPHMAAATARIEQERIRAETAKSVEQSRAGAEAARAQKEYEIAQQNGQFKIQEMQLQKELALLQYANQQRLSLDQVKAQLAKSAMDNQTKRELASAEIQLAQSEGHQNRLVDMHKHNTSLVRDEMSTPNTP